MDWKVEPGIPVPPHVQKGGRPRTEKGKLVCAMKNGESILCDSTRERDNVRAMIRHLGGKSQTRKVQGGWRVWRIA